MNIGAVYDVPGLLNPFDLPGLTPELLMQAVERGEALRDQATSLDAPTRGPMQAYYERVRHLRQALLPHGWTKNDDRNYCTVVSPCGRIAIGVATGTNGTGRPHPTPETCREMGTVTALRVAVNRAQLSLFPIDDTAVPAPWTWLLLSRREADVVHAELSLPDGTTDRNVVCTWQQRYLLEPLELRPDPMRDEETDDGGSGGAPAIDVPVEIRRS